MGRSAHTALDVFYGLERVGRVYDHSPLAFEYAPEWIASEHRLSLSLLPLQAGLQSGPAVQAVFENLLPEGALRDYLTVKHQASTVFSLLRAVAGDTAGAFVLVPAGQRPEPPRYEVTDWTTLAARLSGPTAAAIELGAARARVSLAGAQDKASIALFEDGRPHLPKGSAPSTHILKPNIRRLPTVWHSAANEALVMRAAALAGLPTAEVFYEPHTQACVVRRFDRGREAKGRITRRVQYDLCQLAGIVSERKYEKEGGPGLADCAGLIRRYSTQAAADLRQLVRWVFFNLYVGNQDSHAKNLSLYSLPGQGTLLTPFYDLMCTRLYPGLTAEFAFAIGGERRPGALGPAHLVRMARELEMQPRFVAQQAQEMAAQLPNAMQEAVEVIAPVLPASARTLAARLERFVASNTQRLVKRLVAVET